VKRSQMSVILSLFAVFGSGIAVGAFAYHSYTAKTVSATVNAPVSPQEWRRKYIEEISTRLQLDPTQLGHLNEILDSTRNRFKTLKERQKKEIEEVKSAQSEEIRAILTPTQIPEYEAFRQERQRRMKEMAAREQAAKEAKGKAGN
jgi:hypothetical protein